MLKILTFLMKRFFPILGDSWEVRRFNLLPHTKKRKDIWLLSLFFKNNETNELVVQKKEVSSKHDKCVLVDEVPIESKKEMAKFKTENERKSFLGVADVLGNDETSKKGFNEQENKNISDCQYTHSQTWRHGVENPNLLKENLIFRINLNASLA